MPTITVTQEQYEAYESGHTIQVRPPRKFVLSIIPAGQFRQRFHENSLKAESTRDAVRNWIEGDSPGSSLLRECLPALVAVCPQTTTNGGWSESYSMRTLDTDYYKVDADFNITPWST